jgi:transposase
MTISAIATRYASALADVVSAPGAGLRPEEVLAELRRFLGGEKAALLWDGLPAHRSRAMQAWLNTQRHRLVVERLPAYAPELNPVEGLWANLKDLELANRPTTTLAEVADATEHGIQRVCKHDSLVVGFLAHTGLTLDP